MVRGARTDSSLQYSVRGCGLDTHRRSVTWPSPASGISVTVVLTVIPTYDVYDDGINKRAYGRRMA